MPDGFDLLWEDGPCIVVAKPGGVLTQAPPGIDSLEVRIKNFVKQREGKTGKVYLGLAHRLDRPASGTLVFARNSRATRRLCEQFEDRTVVKYYWAIVEGNVPVGQGSWVDFVRKVPGEARAEVVPEGHPEGRAARLRFRTVAHFDNLSWLQIQLDTGRTHQIRVQAATRGFPILGDFQYGAVRHFSSPVDDPRERWIALHARHLGFHHPMSHERIRVTAPLPDVWKSQPLDSDLSKLDIVPEST